MPLIGYGTYKLSDLPDDAKFTPADAIASAFKSGYLLYDLAFRYNVDDDFHTAWKKSKISRNKIFIAHKIWNTDPNLDYEGTLQQFEAIIKKLHVTYLDLLMLHTPQKNALVCWKALEHLYEKGLVKAIGVSNFGLSQLISFCAHVKVQPMVNQIQLSPMVARPELVEYCQSNNIQIMGWGTIGRGNYSCQEVPMIVDLAKKYQVSPAHICLRWLLQKNIIIIPASRQPERITSNFTHVFKFKLLASEMKQIDNLPQKKVFIPASFTQVGIDFIHPGWDDH